MDSASHGIAVTLCCAREDVEHLSPLVKHLRRRNGVPTALLEGIDADPHLLGSALDSEDGARVFVVCLSEALGPAQFRRIGGVYSARKGPRHYLAELLVEPDETLAMAETVSTAIVKASAANKDPRRQAKAEDGGSNRLRDVVGVTDISAVGSDAIPNHNVRTAPVAKGSSGARGEGRDRGQSSPGDRKDPKLYAKPFPKTEPDPEPDPDSESKREAEARPHPPAKATAASPSQSPNSWVAVVLFLILLAVAGTAVLVYLEDRGAPQVEAARAPATPLRAPAGTGDEQSATASDSDSDSDDDSDDGSATESEETSPEGDDEHSDGDEPGGVDEASIIRDAIDGGEMRAIDLILVAKPGGVMPWRDASTRCRNKSYRGLRGWRLPSLEELKTFRGARVLARERFWSSTLAVKEGDGADHVYVLDLAERSIEPVLKGAADVHVQCVRALSVD